jgi:GGDEF domain-containing protein
MGLNPTAKKPMGLRPGPLSSRVRRRRLKPIRLDAGQDTDVGVSLGVAQAPLCGITGSAVMRAADEALYAAKLLRSGRERPSLRPPALILRQVIEKWR